MAQNLFDVASKGVMIVSLDMKSLRYILGSLLGLVLGLVSGLSATLTFENYTKLGSFNSDGLYNLVGLGTWNGQPVSPSNMPSDDNRRLLATINFFAEPTKKNILFVQVTDVATTFGAYWSGTAFNNVTQTGLRFNFATANPLNLGMPSFSTDFANPGQIRAYGGSTESTEALTTTPGYGIVSGSQNQYLIQTLAGAENGFTSLGNIYGASRIRGGGIFQLTFSSEIDLFQDVNFNASIVESQYGAGNQYIVATAVPEPSISVLTLVAVYGLVLKRKRGV